MNNCREKIIEKTGKKGVKEKKVLLSIFVSVR